MRAFSQLGIFNQAVAMLPATPIASPDENSLEARECRRLYPEVVADMLEGPHDWSFANQRVLLAALVTNDRSDSWLYAYALPSNLGNPVRVLPDLSSLGLLLPVPLPGQPYGEVWVSAIQRLEMPYEIEGQTLYTNTSAATLEYTINDVAGVPITQLAITALATDLAARVCVPVKKDSQRESVLLQKAELAWQRAIADDRNRQPESYADFLPETIAARHGMTC
jgi:hypothetical protein